MPTARNAHPGSPGHQYRTALQCVRLEEERRGDHVPADQYARDDHEVAPPRDIASAMLFVMFHEPQSM